MDPQHQQPQYSQQSIQPQEPQPAAPAPQPQSKGLAITAMVLGIIGILTSGFGIGILLGLIGVIIGIIALTKHAAGKGMAIAGVITGGIAVMFGGIFFAITIVAYNGIQNRGISASNAMDANLIAKKAEAYNTLHGSAQNATYPSYSQLLSNDDPESSLDNATRGNLHEGKSVSKTSPLAYEGCTQGGIITYYDTTNNTMRSTIEIGNPKSC